MNIKKKKSKYYIQFLAGLIALPVVVLLVAYGIMFWRKKANYPPPTVELLTASHFSLTSNTDVQPNTVFPSAELIRSVRFMPLSGSQPVVGFDNLQEALTEAGYVITDLSIHFSDSKRIQMEEIQIHEKPEQLDLFTDGLSYLKINDQEIVGLPFVQWKLIFEDGKISAKTNHVEPIWPPDSDSSIGVAFLMDVAGRYIQIQMDELQIIQKHNGDSNFLIKPIRCRFSIVEAQ